MSRPDAKSEFDYLRQQCLHGLHLLLTAGDNAERQLNDFELTSSPEACAALLVQLQQSVQATYDYTRVCRQVAQFLQQQAARSSNP